jgi:hypothetical protein
MSRKNGTESILQDFSPSSRKNNEANPILHQLHGDCQDSAERFGLKPNHYHELISSGIDPDIIALNFQSIDGDITHEYLLSDALAKLGDGKQTPHSSQYTTSEVARIFKMYNHTLAGGWYCAGVDPLNNYAPMEWGCFKPDFPRLDFIDTPRSKDAGILHSQTRR